MHQEDFWIAHIGTLQICSRAEIWVDTSRLLASYNYIYTNTPTAGRRGATLSATYLGGHITFTSITTTTTHQQPVGVGLHYQLPIWVDTSRLLASHNYNNTPTAGRRGATLSATYLGGHLTLTSIIQLHMYNRIAIQRQNIKSQTCLQTDKTDRLTEL